MENVELTNYDVMLLNERKKSTGVAYLLWFLFGTVGAHRFYLKNTMAGLMYLILWAANLIGFMAMFAMPYEVWPRFVVMMAAGGLSLAWFIDAFILAGNVKTYNAGMRIKYLKLKRAMEDKNK